jgi:hypothetical protein
MKCVYVVEISQLARLTFRVSNKGEKVCLFLVGVHTCSFSSFLIDGVY